jgi:putative acyl-CoA dehydrogenase
MRDFYQEPPNFGNQYDTDEVLRAYLRRRLPADMLVEIEPGLRRLGERVVTDILALGNAAEASPPRHVPYDGWGRRVDRIETSEAWRTLDRVAAEEGLIAIGYERAHGWLSRVDQFVRQYLYSASSALHNCPLAMTDGAARFLELFGDERTQPVLERLTSRDPDRFWTSGQWMTERSGGSDVSATSTVAQPADGSEGTSYRLYGDKWFTSATTSQVAVTLARIEGAPAGSRGLSVFLVELRDTDGTLRNIRIRRLKDKLGTRALPTAELTLEGTPAQLVGGRGDGVRKISALFNVTRVYNAVAAVGGMRRALALARDYADRRTAFGRLLREHPLHAATLAELELECRAAFHLAFRVVELLGREECGEASPAESELLRLLVPVAKLYTAKQAVAVASEAIEAFGGQGYVEDTGLPRLLRDAQVLPIWEGTTNVLSLDVLRAIDKTGALDHFLSDVRARIANLAVPELAPAVERVCRAADRIEVYAERALRDAEGRQTGARAFAYAIARTCMASLLIEYAASYTPDGDRHRAVSAATRWCIRDLAALEEQRLVSL